MNQNEGYELARALAAAFREAAKRHDEATKPKTREPAAPTKYVPAGGLHANPGPEKPAPASVHTELARDYNEVADAIERHAAKETEA